MADGERIHRVIGREVDGVTRTQCEEFIAAKRTEAREDRLNLPRKRKTPLTFSRAAKLYLDGEQESGGSDLTSKKLHVRVHLNPYFGNMRVDRITEFTVKKFRKLLRDQGRAEAGVNRILATYRHMGNTLFKRKLIREPLPMIKLESPNNRRDRVLSPEEEKSLLVEALKDSNAYIWLFIKMGLSTSMRHKEILSARFDRLDTHRRRLKVMVKGGKWRKQPLSLGLTDILQHERDMAEDPDGWIFPNPRSKSGHYDSMKKSFRRCVLRAGMNPAEVTPHTMRHTAITNLADTGVHARTLQEFSSHQTLRMTMRYTHARQEMVDEAIKMMERVKTEPEQLGRRKADDS